MEWKDYEVAGGVGGSIAYARHIRIEVFRRGKWMIAANEMAGVSALAAPDLAQAKTEAAAIVRVALEEALAALVGEQP